MHKMGAEVALIQDFREDERDSFDSVYFTKKFIDQFEIPVYLVTYEQGEEFKQLQSRGDLYVRCGAADDRRETTQTTLVATSLFNFADEAWSQVF